MSRKEKKDHRLRVANVTEEGRYGGPQKRIATVASVLKEMGIDSTVVCPDRESGVLIRELMFLRISFITLRLHHLTKDVLHLIKFIFFFIPEILSLKKVIKKNQFDIVHGNGCWQLKAMIAAKMAGIKTVYSLNDTKTFSVLKQVFTLFANRFVDGFIPTCDRASEYYLKFCNLNSKPKMVIHAPVNTREFNPHEVEPDSAMAHMPGIKIVTVCNVNPGKGIDLFMKIAGLLNKRFTSKKMTFIVVGPIFNSQKKYFNQLKKEQQRLSLQNFHFFGEMDNIKGILKATDIFVCCSRNESGPMSVWEAMSMAKPIVSTDVGDVKEFFNKGRCGLLVPVGDVQRLVQKIGILIEDKELRTSLGKNARVFAEKYLDIHICAKKHASFYKKILM